MFDNLLIGPICTFSEHTMVNPQIQDLFEMGFFPMYVSTKGTLFDTIKSGTDPKYRDSVIGILVSYGYSKLFEA